MRKFSHEDKSLIVDIVDHPGYATLLKLLDACAQSQEEEVLKLDLVVGGENKLVYLKAQAQGARKLYNTFAKHVESLTKAPR